MFGTRLPGALFVLLLAMSGCNRSDAPDDGSVQQVAATPVEAFFRYGTVELGRSRAALHEAIGAADSVTIRTVTNAHDASVTDSVFTVHHPGLAVELYRASFDGRELLASIRISDDRWLKPDSPLRIGMGREQVRLALGDPDREEDGDLFYTCTSCNLDGQDSLELLLDRGVLREIVVQYWLD